MKKIFGGIEMTWKRVIIFAIVIGVYTGLINQVPFLHNTSLTDLAVNFERWFLFALFIMLNCKSPLDAAKKTFVFFLISQPLVYLVEIPFLGFSVLHYYKNWIIWTILTIPMAYIGHLLLKKKNFLSILILLPMLWLYAISTTGYFNEALYDQMHHLYSSIFCLVVPFILFFVIFDKKKYIIISSILYILILTPYIVNVANHRRVYDTILRCSSKEMYFDQNYKVEITNKKLGEVNIVNDKLGDEENYCLKAVFKHTGKTDMILTDSEGNKTEYDLVVTANSYDIKQK